MTTPATRVLVVDDEESIREILTMALKMHGYQIQTAATGYDALRLVQSFAPDIIVLDIMLPDIDGFEVAKRLGSRDSRVPIMYLTARDETQDKIRDLSLGGDDYMTKPFSLEEMVARLQAILRRSGQQTPASAIMTFDDIEMDEDAHEVRRDGQLVPLTQTEYRLLRYFLLNPRIALTKNQLLEHVWQYDFNGDARVLETYVSYLRKKLDKHGPPVIQTVRGIGYALRQTT